MTTEDPLQGTLSCRWSNLNEVLEVQEDKSLQREGNTTTHLEVQEDKLDFQSVTGEVLILLLICLSLFTYRGDT